MTTINRLKCFYSESCKQAHLGKRELGLCVVRSSIDKQKRGNCISYIGLQ